MNKPENKHLMAIPTLLLLTVLTAASARAQTPAATNDDRSDATRTLAFAPRLRLSLTPVGFRLLPATSVSTNMRSRSSTISLMPMAAGPNLQVLGGGTLGRLTKWAGFTSSNSFIGDSTIFEDKNGLVGIGTDTPTSKLTVSGLIQSLAGGFKFPDGTVQATAATTGTIGIVHDSTLNGDGTNSMPLGLAVPLILSGSVDKPNAVFTVLNAAGGGNGLFAFGGAANSNIDGGTGLLSVGGPRFNASPAGEGLVSFGGSANEGSGGPGGTLIGGASTAGNGGVGLFAIGAPGFGTGEEGGRGIVAIPGQGGGGATPGLAGEFFGDVSIEGNLSKGGGSFKIDHPLDPENKYLYHSFVESPDMKNIYDGTITTDENGEATVELSDWFEALNCDFRYQLTVIGTFSQAIVAEKIKGNRFKIRTSAPNVEVSWQVTGIRKDAYAERYRIPVEENKSEAERGYYLHHAAFNQPKERSVEWARNREMMQQFKQRRIEAEQAQKRKPKIDR